MKKISILTATAIALLFSVSTWAVTDDQGTKQADMPMMNQGNHSSMMSDKNHGSMMNGENHEMTMDPHMMQMMMMMGHHQHHNSAMNGAKGGMAMNPEMMQMRQQHMSNMEQRLANIEALLEKLVEMQKP
jgi:hypothetical protein